MKSIKTLSELCLNVAKQNINSLTHLETVAPRFIPFLLEAANASQLEILTEINPWIIDEYPKEYENLWLNLMNRDFPGRATETNNRESYQAQIERKEKLKERLRQMNIQEKLDKRSKMVVQLAKDPRSSGGVRKNTLIAKLRTDFAKRRF